MNVSVGIAGGTGALGRGLAARLASAGLQIHIASRDPRRGADAAAELAERARGSVRGGGMDELSLVDVVILAVPYNALEAYLHDAAAYVDGKIVVSAVNPLAFDDAGPYPLAVPVGSAAQLVAVSLPGARVAAAFHTLSSGVLGDLDDAMDDDVPVFGDDPEAVSTVIDVIDRIEGCRGVGAGALRLASVMESLTPVLISVNRRYRAHAGVRFTRMSTQNE